MPSFCDLLTLPPPKSGPDFWNVGQVIRDMGIIGKTYYSWRKENDGMKNVHAKRLKCLERKRMHHERASRTCPHSKFQ